MKLKSLHPFIKYNCYLRYSKTEDRKYVDLVSKSCFRNRTTISFARWLMSVFLKKEIEKYIHIHHINNNKKEDRIKNLEIVKATEHMLHKHSGRKTIDTICPICEKIFSRFKNLTQFGCKTKTISLCSFSCRNIFLSLSLDDQNKMRYNQTVIKEYKT